MRLQARHDIRAHFENIRLRAVLLLEHVVVDEIGDRFILLKQIQLGLGEVAPSSRVIKERLRHIF